MDEATRRQLLSSADAFGRAKSEPARLSDLTEGVDGGVQGDPWSEPAAPVASSSEAVAERGEAASWVPAPTVKQKPRLDVRSIAKIAAIGLVIFILAAVPRLYVLFFVTDPQNPGLGWYGDTFHHWQIAYLSKEIGFSHGFLRLWDFKGMEYFWGLLHPLLLAALFRMTGSVDIIIPRLVSLVAGSFSTVLVFLLARRYFNTHVALAASTLAALNPVGVFSDVSGMQEPLGVVLLLAGVAMWPSKALWAGLLWALAGMVRAEYWIFGCGLVAFGFLSKGGGERKIALGVGWGLPTLLYMKYLLDKTGNLIYPVYWSFIGNAAGAWMLDVPLNSTQTLAMWGFRILAVVSGAASVWVVARKPRYGMLFLLGLGNVFFLSILLGFSAYVRGFLTRFLVDRIFMLPYIFLGVVVSALLLYRLRGRGPVVLWRSLGWAGIVIILAVSQMAWRPIWSAYEPGSGMLPTERELASQIASLYRGGVISLPEDRPWLTYLLVHDFGLSATSLEGQMYDAFAYIEEDDPFANWSESRDAVEDWLVDRDVEMLVFYNTKEQYQEMIRREPQWFHQEGSSYSGAIQIYSVAVP